MPLKPITDWCTHYALFFGDNGEYLGKKKLNYKESTFKYNKGVYHFLPLYSSHFKLKGIMKTKKYYHYNINNPMPLIIKKNVEPLFYPKVYKTILDSDLVTKLNPKKNELMDFLFSWKGIVLVLVVGGALYYFSSGGTITA